jgi:hypothetical protein
MSGGQVITPLNGYWDKDKNMADPNFLLMALAGLSRDPNAGMNALKGYTVQNDINTKEAEKSASSNIASGYMGAMAQKMAQDQIEQNLQNRGTAIQQMPPQVMTGPQTATPDEQGNFPADTGQQDQAVPNEARQQLEAKLSQDAEAYEKARINPFDAIPSIIKANPDAPPAVVAHYVGEAYKMWEKDKSALDKFKEMLFQHNLNLTRDYKKEEAKASFAKEGKLHPTGLTTKEGVPVSQDLTTGQYMIPGPEGKPVVFQGETYSKAPADKNKQPYIAPDGRTVLVDTSSPEAQGIIDSLKLKPLQEKTAQIRASIFTTVPDKATGTFFNRQTQKWMMNTESGPIELTSEQQRNLGLNTREAGATQVQRGKIMPFIQTADKNFDLVLDQSQKTDRTGVPVVNRWLLAGKKSLAGDPQVASFDLAVRTAINEYAKVTTTVTGGGITSDTARKEIEQLLNTAHTPDQVKAVVGLARQEMTNRATSYGEYLDTIKGKNPGSTVTPPAPQPIQSKKPDAKWIPGKGIVPIGGQ